MTPCHRPGRQGSDRLRDSPKITHLTLSWEPTTSVFIVLTCPCPLSPTGLPYQAGLSPQGFPGEGVRQPSSETQAVGSVPRDSNKVLDPRLVPCFFLGNTGRGGGGEGGEETDSLLPCVWAVAAKYQTGAATTREFYLLAVPEAGSGRSRGQRGWFLLGPLSSACRWPCLRSVCVSVS